MDKLEKFESKIAALPASLKDGLDMHALLGPALDALPDLLKQGIDQWNGMYIDYEPPFLMRLYRSFDVVSPKDGKERKLFLSLHYFFSSGNDGDADQSGFPNPYAKRPELIGQENENNYHPHPWAASFLILKGVYKQELGLATELGYSSDSKSSVRPKPYALATQKADDPKRCSYAFNDPYQWHRVLPDAGGDVATIMLTYKPDDWEQVGPKPLKQQRSLSDKEKRFMVQYFSNLIEKQSNKIKPTLKPRPRLNG